MFVGQRPPHKQLITPLRALMQMTVGTLLAVTVHPQLPILLIIGIALFLGSIGASAFQKTAHSPSRRLCRDWIAAGAVGAELDYARGRPKPAVFQFLRPGRDRLHDRRRAASRNLPETWQEIYGRAAGRRPRGVCGRQPNCRRGHVRRYGRHRYFHGVRHRPGCDRVGHGARSHRGRVVGIQDARPADHRGVRHRRAG